MARLKQENASIKINPTKPLTKQQASYLRQIIMQPDQVFIAHGFHRLKEDDFVEVNLTHSLIKYRKKSNPNIVCCEILANKECQSGSYGIVRESLVLVIIIDEHEKLTIKVRQEHKKHAIKMFRLELTSKQNITHEAEMIKQSNSRLRCKLPLFDMHCGYLIMTFIKGITLHELTYQLNNKQTKLGYLDLLYILLSATNAIQQLHNQGILHLDVKGPNLIVDTKNCIVTAVDFNFACSIDKAHITAAKGTPGFTAPEVVLNAEIGIKADVFSLGVTLALLLGDRSILKLLRASNNGMFRFFLEKQQDEKFKKLFHHRPIPHDKNIRGLLKIIAHAMTRFDKTSRTTLDPVKEGILLLIQLEQQRSLIKRSGSKLLFNKDEIIACKNYPYTTLRSAIKGMQELIELEKLCWEKENVESWVLSPQM